MTKEEAIKILKGILTEAIEFENSVCYVTGEDREPLEMAIKALENQKTGHWIEIDDYPHEDFECDCCGGKVYGTEEPYEEYKYCPNCGAKMAESEG